MYCIINRIWYTDTRISSTSMSQQEKEEAAAGGETGDRKRRMRWREEKRGMTEKGNQTRLMNKV